MACSHRSMPGTGMQINMDVTCMKKMQSIALLCAFLVMTVVSLPLHAVDRAAGRVHLGVSPNKTQAKLMLSEDQISGLSVTGDTYSVAPLVQDPNTAFFSSDAGGPTIHTFDEIDESGGSNLLGTEGGTFIVTEEIVSIDGGVDRIMVRVNAVNASNESEPWVDSSQSDRGFTSWRLDVGSTTADGTDPIQPGSPFTLVDSGFNVFNSAGETVGSFDLTEDNSNATSLSGVAALGNGGENIAGVDVSSIQIYWDISFGPSDVTFKNGFE
jgi:hypothetical protein